MKMLGLIENSFFFVWQLNTEKNHQISLILFLFLIDCFLVWKRENFEKIKSIELVFVWTVSSIQCDGKFFFHLELNPPVKLHVIIEYVLLLQCEHKKESETKQQSINIVLNLCLFLFIDHFLCVLMIVWLTKSFVSFSKRIFIKSSIFTIKLISLFKERD